MTHKPFILFLLLLSVLTTSAQEGKLKLRSCRMTNHDIPGIVARKATLQLQQPKTTSINPYIGDRHQLVILASFSDRYFSDDEPTTLEKWNKIFNQEKFSEEPYVGSVHDYFYDQSYGKFRITFDLLYIEMGKVSRYASNDSDDENSQFLVNDIVDSLLVRDIDWSLYDWDDDGFINQLLIVYAGKGMNDGGGSNSIWPHQNWLTNHINPQTHKNCDARMVTYNSQEYLIDCYCAVSEDGRTRGTFGTICHEYTHCFGFPDFYYGSQKNVGEWDLMDYGNYNGNGYIPCGYSAHERMLMGWLSPIELSNDTTITDMAALNENGEAYLIRNDNYTNEFYIIENRQQQGWDAQHPGSGILIFHIDYNEHLWKDYDGIPNTYSQKHYMIFKANNNNIESGWPYPYATNNELTNTSTPAASLWNANTDSTLYMNKELKNIAVNNHQASFTFTPLTSSISEMENHHPSAPDVYYNISGQRIKSIRNGIYIKNGKKIIKQLHCQ